MLVKAFAIMAVAAVALGLLAGEARSSLLSVDAPAAGGTGEVTVTRGYVVFSNLTLYNTTGGLASTELDTVILRYRVFYNEDAGNYTIFIYFNNSGYFDGAASVQASFPDNQTYVVLVGSLGQAYPQGAVVYAYTSIKKEG